MVPRQFTLFFLLLVALALLGAGCNGDRQEVSPATPELDASMPVSPAPPADVDAGSSIPEGWQVYKSGAAEFQYPENWVVFQNPDEPGIELSVAFESLPTEFPNPIEYQVRLSTIEAWVASLAPEAQVAKQEDGVRSGNHTWTRIVTAGDQEERRDIFYITSVDGRTYAFTSGYEMAGVLNDNLPTLEQMVGSFSAGGAQ